MGRSEAGSGGSARPIKRKRRLEPLAALLCALLFFGLVPAGGFHTLEAAADDSSGAETLALPSGFREETVFSGLNLPTAVRFAPDGRVFVAEKAGLIKVFSGLDDSTPKVFADLRTKVYNLADSGLLGLALDPEFESRPHVYVSYTYDAPIGKQAPVYGDSCDRGSGNCPTSGRLGRLEAAGESLVGTEKVLLRDWCRQFATHAVDALEFGSDGALYASAGEGATAARVDYGQLGNPSNPCGDPPVAVGGNQSPPTAQGGSLRSQDLQTPQDPVGLTGTVIRVDPTDGKALPDNPLYSMSDPKAQRVIAYGLRNPFSIAARPGTDEIWLGDVGWDTTEEINVIDDPTDAEVENFGWPCYEGPSRQPEWDALNMNLCENLYRNAGATTEPHFAYRHDEEIVAGEDCIPGGSVAGLSFYEGTSYPQRYRGALFFGDYVRGCIWAMLPGADGVPNPNNIELFSDDATPVMLETGPNGDLFYVDIFAGSIHRITYADTNQPPVARAQATPTNGPAPLEVDFDASASSDSPGDSLSYAWDLDGDGQHDDSTAIAPTHVYTRDGIYDATVRVTDQDGASDVSAPVRITVGDTPPQAAIDRPSEGTTYAAGDEISFSGRASDEQDGALPASALSWTVTLHHCPTTCHQHHHQTIEGVAEGSFVAPDHEQPSHLELTLTATDASGLSDDDSVLLYPERDAGGPDVAAPAEALRAQATLGGSNAPVDVTWSARDGENISSYELQRSVNGGPYTRVALSSPQAREVTQRLTFGNTYRYRVRATDDDGNVGEWAEGAVFEPRRSEETAAAVAYSGSWRRRRLRGASGGFVRFAGANGRRATFQFNGQDVAWVSTTGPNRGRAAVLIDGEDAGLVDLYSKSTRKKVLVFTASLPAGSHVLEVRVLGQKQRASKGKRIDVDAFVAL